MSGAPEFLLVDEHVARNPVARAVAKRKVILATRDFQTRLLMLPDGERVDSDLHAASKVLAVAIRIMELAGLDSSPEARVMHGGMSALVDLAQRAGRWRKLDAVAVDQALQHALNVYTSASAQQTQAAHRWVMSLDRSAQQPQGVAA